MSTTPRFAGVDVVLGGRTFVLPPMSLGIVEKFQARIDTFLKGTETNAIGLMIDVMHACLRRNYPELTRDEVGDLLDTTTINEAFITLLHQSGWRADTDAAAGEAPGNPGATVSPGTGAPSTPT